ncbi:MAG: DUF2183 domain-containing protein [Deltaproteobacteria bacterium]|nr:DUF2183 domain-containing protein [Deltaproteobacteria bacterium]
MKSDEELLFFPTIASFDPSKSAWHVDIHAWVFEREENSKARNTLIKALRNELGFDNSNINNDLFASRARWFLVDNERNKELTVRFADQEFFIGKTMPNGHLLKTLEVPPETMSKLQFEPNPVYTLTYQAVLPKDDKRIYTGQVQLLQPKGISVISDIDDTIKVSEVTNPDRKVLLRNTFINEYKAVDGMAEIYRQWANGGVQFHYVSGSPWQLYAPLSMFMESAGFPNGSMKLRNLRFEVNTILAFLSAPDTFKKTAIKDIIERSPMRQFILVGDSGEHDPEIYADLYRRYHKQILHIFIRDLTGKGGHSKRYHTVFKDIPESKLTVFQEATELIGFNLSFR